MPVIVGPIEILNVSGDGILNVGDAAFVTPKSSAKTFGGSGGFNTGGLVFSATGASGTNVIDTDVVDEPMAGNK
ncbi:spore germination protein [Neobacillus mesonae]|uniref:spore germination protein n=1 Tax=Neobacillus mesonae TaxID=1193713 RepID=UPI00203F167D|nr:spore germination protein [Neobacillus mesonae]MCM3568040.1 spore germination protein [Neobacillus mesonae]